MLYLKVCLLAEFRQFLKLSYPGIVMQAVGATFVTFAVCLGLYKYKIVKVTEQFKSVVVAATLAIATYYLDFLVVFYVYQLSTGTLRKFHDEYRN